MRTVASDTCFALLEALREDGPTERVAREWDALWLREQALIHARDIRLAGLVVYVGWMVLSALGDHRSAAGLMRLYFCHPDIDKDLPTVRLSHRGLLARALLWSAEPGEAATEYAEYLAGAPRGSVAAAVHTVRDDLVHFCAARPTADAIAPQVVELARSVATRLRRIRAARSLPTGPATCSELLSALS